MLGKALFDRQQHRVIFLIFILFLNGCATKTVVTPHVGSSQTKPDFYLEGVIEYDSGKKEYLPRTIKEDHATDLILRYEYALAYGRDRTPQALPLLNPLTILGFPIGENTLVVTGVLTILKGNQVVKEYKATCGMEKARSLFSEGETFSELRKKGLDTVRDNIELQMYEDREFLSSLASSE